MNVTKTANICILTLKFAKSNRVYPVRVCLQIKVKAPSSDDAFTFGGEEETRPLRFACGTHADNKTVPRTVFNASRLSCSGLSPNKTKSTIFR